MLEFEAPAGTLAGDTFARFRISTLGGLSAIDPDLPAADGEVEDVPLTIVPRARQLDRHHASYTRRQRSGDSG